MCYFSQGGWVGIICGIVIGTYHEKAKYDKSKIERKLEKRVTELPSNLDEAADTFAHNGDVNGVGGDDYEDDLRITFKAGAKWMAEQGKTVEGHLIQDVEEGNGDFLLSANYIPYCSKFKDKEKVIVQIRKK